MNQDHPAILNRLIERALSGGADAADARISMGASLTAEVREGALETIESEESSSVSLRALIGKRQAHVSGADLSESGLEALASRVVDMAKAAPEDPYCGLASADDLATEFPDLGLDGDDAPSAVTLEARALEGEAAALAVPEVKQSGHASASWSRRESHVASSNGFAASRHGGTTSTAILAIAERDGAMERDYDSRMERKYASMPSPAEIGRIAGERAAARLGARKIESTTAPVIFHRRLSASLVGAFTNAISGPAVARGVSFLKDKLGEQVFAKGVNIVDEPLRRGGFGSRAFDGEGRPVETRKLIDGGVLTQWLLSGPSAMQLGLSPNGFASMGFGDPPGVSTSNLDLQPGEKDLEGLMAEAGKGLLVTDMFGPSLNPNTGDYSVGVSGFWIEGGEQAFPVTEVTVAGDLISMFARLVPGSDLEIRGATNAPSLLIDGLTLAGR
ncbi:MAG: TldD/PmbA family protein [Pseudomonadota bacterium]